MHSKNSIAFLGTLVPDTDEFNNEAFYRSANLVQAGIMENLSKYSELKILSSQPIPTFPRGKSFFCTRKVLNYSENIKITTIPAINIVVLREIMRGIYAFFSLIFWAIKNYDKKRCIIVYNTYSPPLPIVYIIGKITNSKLLAIIYDLGMPPKSLKLDFFRKFIYQLVELSAKLIIPRLDGRIVITEAIAEDYAPGKHFLMIDGGISKDIVNYLFPLEYDEKRIDTTFLCAGSLWTGNGVRLLLDALKINKNSKIKIFFAGKGPDLDLILNASKNDVRIQYLGMLSTQELFEVYKKAHVLLNIRVIPCEEGRYLFPSKLLEYLVVGKFVVTTKAVHIEREYGNYCHVLNDIEPETISEMFDEVSEISNETFLNKGLNSRGYMLKNNTWEAKTKQIINYIQNEVI
jgi:hypothetical protein